MSGQFIHVWGDSKKAQIFDEKARRCMNMGGYLEMSW
jgi:hypothetical protein